jgi:hypothetical protein
MITYDLIEKTLFIKDQTTGKVLWQGLPFGCAVEKIMPLLDHPDCIVLLEQNEFSRSDYHHLGNLVKVSSNGKIIWAAQLPETIDVYVNFGWDENMIFANSWSGFQVQIDPENGKILKRVFTK